MPNAYGQFNLDGDIALYEQDFTPPVPSAGAACHIYLKDNNLVVQWNEGGTAYYKSLDLSGTVATWTHGTAAP